MDKEIFKSKYFIFIFSFALGILIYFFSYSNALIQKYFIIYLAITPVLCLIFGPFAALGVSCFLVINNITSGAPFFIALLNGFVLFFISIVSLKLWYTFMNKDKSKHIRLNSTFNLLKYIINFTILIVLYYAMMFIIFRVFQSDFILDYNCLCNFNTSVNIFLNIYIIGILFGIIGILIVNRLNIPIYSPKNYKFQNIIPINNKINYILLLIVILNILSYLFAILHKFILAISIILSIIYIITPIDDNFNKEDILVENSIYEKLLFRFYIICSLISLFISNFTAESMENISFGYIGLEFSIVLMLAPIIHLYFVEKNITNPITEISKIIKDYRKKDKLPKHTELKNKFGKYENSNDDISILIFSLYKMFRDVRDNLTNLKKITSENTQYETELNVANKIQNQMIRVDFKEFEKNQNFEIYGSMVPAKEVGGDFYDYFKIDEENIGISIGDVSGKGIPAALFMVKTMTLIRNHINFDNKVSKIFTDVNNILCKRNTEEYFVTCWLGKLNVKTGELTFVNAGHNQPIINYKKEIRYLDTKPGLVLAAMEGISYKENRIKLEKEDFIVLFTDGVTEANDNYKEFYGEERLKKVVNYNKEKNPEEIIKEIKKDLRKFTNDKQFDDTTIIILKYKGEI